MLIAAIIITVRPDWRIADPICTFLFSFLVAIFTMPIMRHCALILLEAAPPEVDVGALKTEMFFVSNISAIKELKVFALCPGKNAMMAEVVTMSTDASEEEKLSLISEIEKICKKQKFNIHHVTVSVDSPAISSSLN